MKRTMHKSKRALLVSGTFLLLALTLSSCGVKQVNRLTDERFPPTPENQEVKLYVNEVRQPHIKIAQVQSFSAPKSDKESKRRQLEELVALSREMGGNAVVNVRQLNHQVRGMVMNERTPFPSLQQGTTERYFLRGTAIRYVDAEEAERFSEPEEEPVPTGETSDSTDNIPQVNTQDPDEDSAGETFPRGLGPTFR